MKNKGGIASFKKSNHFNEYFLDFLQTITKRQLGNHINADQGSVRYCLHIFHFGMIFLWGK